DTRYLRAQDLTDGHQRAVARAAVYKIARRHRAGLERDRPLPREPPIHQLVELPRVEPVAWPLFDGVGQVDDDDVEHLIVRLEPPTGILEGQLGARVVKRAGMELREHRAGNLDNLAVDVHHQRPLDRSVP